MLTRPSKIDVAKYSSPMAISDEPSTVGNGVIRTGSVLNHSSDLRRRPSATSVNGLFDSTATVEGESSGEELAKDSSSDDSISSDQHNVVNPEQTRLPDISAIKFAYRPSVPAHRRIKESPLSSDNIFRQVVAVNLCFFNTSFFFQIYVTWQ